jgi:hypothetical protein
MKSETRQNFIRLKELRDQAGNTLFERLRLATACLQDDDFVAEIHRGDIFRAQDAIAGEFFPDMIGPSVAKIDFAKMLSIYREFPEEQFWKDHKYNLIAMEILYDEKRKQAADLEPKRSRRAATLKEIEELEGQAKQLGAVIEQRNKLIESKDRMIEQLRQKIEDLTAENAYLKGRIAELESQLGKNGSTPKPTSKKKETKVAAGV